MSRENIALADNTVVADMAMIVDLRVIADLDSRGHSSLTLKEDGSVCVHEDDNTKDIPQEHLTAFPQKVYWPRLGQVLESEGLSARVQDNEIAVSW